MDNSLIKRQEAIDALLDELMEKPERYEDGLDRHDIEAVLGALPSVQPEPAIPLSWIESKIDWLKSLDNEFSLLSARMISDLVNMWKDEQDG